MPSPYFIYDPTTSISGAGIGIGDGAANVLVYVTDGAWVVSTGSYGIFLTGGAATLAIDGLVTGNTYGIALGFHISGAADTGGFNTLTIGSTGHIANTSLSAVAILADGGGNRIANNGQIDAGNVGVSISGGNNSIMNTGRITANSYGISTINDEGIIGGRIDNFGNITSIGGAGVYLGGSYTINNSGVVDGQLNGVLTVGSGNSIINSGAILSNTYSSIRFGSLPGDVNVVSNVSLLSSHSSSQATISDDAGSAVVTNSGRIEQAGGYAIAVSLGDGADSLNNLAGGAIIGSVDLAGTDISNDTLDNVGSISGNVSVGAGLDSVTNSGSISGSVDLGGVSDLYADTLTNSGTIGGSVSCSQGDTIANRAGATIAGNIANSLLGAGITFRVTNDGLIGGAVTSAGVLNALVDIRNTGIIRGGVITDFGNDTLLNEGAIEGDVSLSNGGDAVTNTGSIFGDIDLGAGDNYADTLANYGLIDGSITASFVDTIVNHAGATVTGNVDNTLAFAGLTHSVTNHGFIGGDVTSVGVAGSLVSITNTGAIAGSVMTAAGTDLLTNSGSIGGNVDLGSGDDIVDNALGIISGTVNLGAGIDTYTGGAGRDRVNGGGDNDDIELGAGDDAYFASANDGNDDIDAGSGIDTYSAAAITTAVTVDLASGTASGADIGLDLLTGFERIVGGTAGDTLTGNSGANRIAGNGGNDTIDGSAGADRLIGGLGDDMLIGGTGRDVMTGGTVTGSIDADTFRFTTTNQSGTTETTRDVITDFAIEDTIHLAAIDANTTVAGNQAFSAIGTAAFSNVAGQLRWSLSNGNTIVEGDTNGDGTADFSIQINGDHIGGSHVLSTTNGVDFVL